MAESLILDAVSEDAANAQLDITGTGYGLLEHKYPQPPVAAQWASSVDTEGSRLGSVKHENRQISITLDVDGLTALRALQAKLGKLHREGGTLKRTLSDATVVVFDVLTVEGYDPDFGFTFDLGGVSTVSFTLTCLPYGRGPEVTLSDHVETTLPVLIFTETGIKGDIPALGRLVVDNDQAGVLQKSLVWAVEETAASVAESQSAKRHNSTAVPLYSEFEAATGIGLMNATTLTAGPAGASGAGSNVARQGGLTTSFASYASYTSSLIGRFRLFARVQTPVTNAGVVQVRVRYATLGQSTPTVNEPAVMSASWNGSWRLLDLGEIVSQPIETGPVGSGPGLFQIEFQALSSSGADDIDFDFLVLFPVHDHLYGEVTDSVGMTDAAATTPVGSGSVILRHDRVRRFGPGALAAGYSTPQKYEGNYLRVPPAGAEGHGARFILKFSRGVIDTGADSAIDDMSARLSYSPRYLTVPSP